MAPEYFQQLNERNFGDLEGVLIYIDDVLITAESVEEHDKILERVLQRARQLGVKFNSNKVQLRLNSVKYLGHIFSKAGMEVDTNRITAINAIEN